MSCMFRFSAKHFDVHAYLAQSSLKPDEVFQPGNYNQTALETWITEYSGFCIIASNAGFNDFNRQVLDVTKFIHINEKELLDLGQIKDKVNFFFDFGLSTTLFNEDVWVDTFHFPVEFMQLLCKVGAGMEISYCYPPSD